MTERLIAFIEAQILSGRADGSVAPDSELLASGLLDSLGVFSLVFFIEEEFQISVPPQDVTLQNFASVSEIVRYLSAQG